MAVKTERERERERDDEIVNKWCPTNNCQTMYVSSYTLPRNDDQKVVIDIVRLFAWLWVRGG